MSSYELKFVPAIQSSLQQWLETHYLIYKQLNVESLPVSSDCIESLFGKFKNINQRGSHQDINRTALIIPLLCGIELDQNELNDAFHEVPHKELKKWENENVPYTQRKRKIEFQSSIAEQKPVNLVAI